MYVNPLVPILPRTDYLCTTARRKVAPSLPSRFPLRALPTLNGLPVPPHARRRQPASRPLAPHVPNDRQGVHSYTCVLTHSSLPFILMIIFHSVRSYVLAWCARKWNGHGPPRRTRRGGRGHGERDSPAASFLVLLAQAREPRSAAWAATSSSRDGILRRGRGTDGFCFLLAIFRE